MKSMAAALGSLIVAVGVTWSAVAHDGPFPGGTESHIDIATLPTTTEAAMADGYLVPPPIGCVPGMGRHAVKPGAPILLFDNGGELIGVEYTTRLYPVGPEAAEAADLWPRRTTLPTERRADVELGFAKLQGALAPFGIDVLDPSTHPVAGTGWSGPMGPHPGMPEGTVHWDLHVYLTDATNACG